MIFEDLFALSNDMPMYGASCVNGNIIHLISYKLPQLFLGVYTSFVSCICRYVHKSFDGWIYDACPSV